MNSRLLRSYIIAHERVRIIHSLQSMQLYSYPAGGSTPRAPEPARGARAPPVVRVYERRPARLSFRLSSSMLAPAPRTKLRRGCTNSCLDHGADQYSLHSSSCVGTLVLSLGQPARCESCLSQAGLGRPLLPCRLHHTTTARHSQPCLRLNVERLQPQGRLVPPRFGG